MIAGVVALVASAACALYGLAVRGIRSGTRFHRVWFALALVAAAFGALRLTGAWWALPAPARTSACAVAVLLAAIVLVGVACALSGMRAQGEPGLDAIVVLGAQLRADGPSVALRARLDRAAAYLAENPRTTCVVSGGRGRNEPTSEAAGMAAYLVARGVAPSRLRQEARSRTTEENLRLSAALLDVSRLRVGIVTSDFHVFRAVRTARRLGYGRVCGIAARSTAWCLPNNLLRESLAIAKATLARLYARRG